jgi:hypothetical protein
VRDSCLLRTNLEREFGPLVLVGHASDCRIARIQLDTTHAYHARMMAVFLGAAVGTAKDPQSRHCRMWTAQNPSEAYAANMLTYGK